MKSNLRQFLYGLIFCLSLCGTTATAQTASFTYQGKLTDNNLAATGTYQMQFSLFNAPSGGNQLTALLTKSAVTVTNGIFTVSLDFGELIFDEEDRYLQISVFSTATNAFVALTPRQHITSAPYAIRSAYSGSAGTASNAQNLGNVPAGNFVQTGDARLTDSRPPTAGSTNYIQNGLAQQSASNFNISGNGTAGGTLSGGTLNAATQYNIGGVRVLSVAGTDNFFAGEGAGAGNTSGVSNAFFGRNAGLTNTEGNDNSFFGRSAGQSNSAGDNNSFFGRSAGAATSTGGGNSFFGRSAGSSNTLGGSNSFFGWLTGSANTFGANNAFVGKSAGEDNTIGSNNAFFGMNAGNTNTTGTSNTYIGYNAKGADSITNATAIGANAFVNQSNQIVIGTDTNTLIIPGNSVTQGTAVFNSLRVNTVMPNGIFAVCRSLAGDLSSCSSSLRYKTNIAPFGSGLNLVNRLQPITFDWKTGGMRDLGLGAEDVAAVEPLLVIYDKDGQVEGVKYDRIGVVLLNAVKEQQAQIQKQQEQIELLKKLVCQTNAQAAVCK